MQQIMQQITVEEIKASLASIKSCPDPSSALPGQQKQSLQLAVLEGKADAALVAAAVAEVQLVKQVSINEDQRAILIAELLRLNLTPRRLREMAENVKRRCTFGTIAFEHWIADDIVTGEELVEERRRMHREHLKNLANIDSLVDIRIRERVDTYRHRLSEHMQAVDKEAAELAAWRDRSASYAKARTAWYEQASARAKQRLARVKAQLRGMELASRLRVWERAIARGDVRGCDMSMVEQSHLFPDLLAGAMEEMAKEAKP